MSNSRIGFVLLLIVLASFSGCGHGEFALLTGRVTLDGEPLPTAVITFISEGGTSGYANVDSSGRYVAKSGSDKGLKPGKYKISVIANKPEVITDRKEAKIPQLITPPKYADPNNSGFEYNLTDAGGTYDLELKSK